ncbi:MAG: hypothetical protein JWN46_701 [Acidimicrobiales bacterium]|nr:hypothetical protein [Acidimicrobiales bacterium]
MSTASEVRRVLIAGVGCIGVALPGLSGFRVRPVEAAAAPTPSRARPLGVMAHIVGGVVAVEHQAPNVDDPALPLGVRVSDVRSARFMHRPLRNSFSLVPELRQGHPYSCYALADHRYVCRTVYGHEATGNRRDFDVLALAVDHASDYVAPYGRLLTVADRQYEGCVQTDRSWYRCDYAIADQSTRSFAQDNGFWMDIFRNWASYTTTQQGNCVATTVGGWMGQKTVVDIWNACRTRPWTRDILGRPVTLR